MSYSIPAAGLSIVLAKVSQFNRRGSKRGFAPLEVTTIREFEQVTSTTLEGGVERKQTRHMLEIEIAGEVPVLAGYAFLANVQHTPAGNIVRRAPVTQGAELPELEAFRTAEPVCHHCGHKRARKDTFVLRTPAGALVQIGRNCLASYIGSADPEIALRLWALSAELERLCSEQDGEGWGGCGAWYYETHTYLAHACAAIRMLGFKPSSFDSATRSTVAFSIGRPPSRDSGSLRDWQELQPTKADAEQAEAVRAWVAEQDGSSDYMHSAKVACALPRVERTEGLLCAVVNTYLKAMGQARLLERKGPAVSEHFGTVGKREAFTFTVTRKVCIDGNYGTRTIVGLEDGAGRAAVWFASGVPELSVGDKVTGRATVKEHGDYKGTKQTTLSRCAFEKVLDAACA